MQQAIDANPDLSFRPLDAGRWPDFCSLFGEKGACGGCWCMWWRSSHAEFERRKGEGNKEAMHQIVASGETPGILAYAADQPIGWCSLSPRSQLPRLSRSRILAPLDDQPVWSLSCFFVHRNYRRRGVTVALIQAAVEWVRQQGGGVIEAYPVEPRSGKMPPVFVYTGLSGAFRKAGFVECARRSETRPIMRRTVNPTAGSR